MIGEMYSNPDLIRENKTWVIFTRAWTKEGEEHIAHCAHMLKFEMPEGLSYGEELKNNVNGAARFYMFWLDRMGSVIRNGLINAADLPKEIVDLIPYFTMGLNHLPATIENYVKMGKLPASYNPQKDVE